MKAIKAYDADTIIAGHVSRLGKKGDIENQIELFDDIKDGAIKGLSTANMMPLFAAKEGPVTPGSKNMGNSWLYMNEFLARVVDICYDHVMGKGWNTRLSGVEVTLRSHCLSVSNQVRIVEDFTMPTKGDGGLSDAVVYPACSSGTPPCIDKNTAGKDCLRTKPAPVTPPSTSVPEEAPLEASATGAAVPNIMAPITLLLAMAALC